MTSTVTAILLLAASVFFYLRFPPRENPPKRPVLQAVICYFLAAISVLLFFVWLKALSLHSGVALHRGVIFSIGPAGLGVLIAAATGLQALFVWVHRLLAEAERGALGSRVRIGVLLAGIAAALPFATWWDVDFPLYASALILLGFLGLFDLFIERRALNLTWMAVWIAVLAAGAAYGLTTYSALREKEAEQELAQKLEHLDGASVKEQLAEFSRLLAADDTLTSLLSTPVPFTVPEEVLRREIARYWARLPFLTELFYIDRIMLVNPQLKQSVVEEYDFASASGILAARDALPEKAAVFSIAGPEAGFALVLPDTGTFSGNMALLEILPSGASASAREPRFLRAVSLFSGMYLLLIGLTALWVFVASGWKALPAVAALPFFEKPSLRNRIQLLLAGFTLGSFLLIGLVSYLFFRRSGIIEQVTLYEYLSALLNLYVFLLLAALAIAVAAGNSITRPLLVIGEKLQGLRLGRNEPLEWSGQDEIGALVAAYNGMIAKVEESAELLRRSEREGAWREMARQVAHEIKNPLTPMKLSIQHLQRAFKADPEQAAPLIRSMSDTLIGQIDTLTRIADEFSHFARTPEPQKENLDWRELVQSVAQLFQNEQAHAGARISLQLPDEAVPIHADRSQLIRVLNNLIKNAVQAIPEGRPGKVEIDLQHAGDKAVLSVRDNGTGIPEEVQPKVFSPNFTTKSSGMGLGLAMCKNIIDLTGGRIWFETEEGKGAVFFLELAVEKVTQSAGAPDS